MIQLCPFFFQFPAHDRAAFIAGLAANVKCYHVIILLDAFFQLPLELRLEFLQGGFLYGEGPAGDPCGEVCPEEFFRAAGGALDGLLAGGAESVHRTELCLQRLCFYGVLGWEKVVDGESLALFFLRVVAGDGEAFASPADVRAELLGLLKGQDRACPGHPLKLDLGHKLVCPLERLSGHCKADRRLWSDDQDILVFCVVSLLGQEGGPAASHCIKQQLHVLLVVGLGCRFPLVCVAFLFLLLLV